jgi:hypothetical protein
MTAIAQRYEVALAIDSAVLKLDNMMPALSLSAAYKAD